MAIELDDRIDRALALARARGPVAASRGVLSALGPRANGLATMDERNAVVFVALATEVDARGHARLDAVPSRALPTIAVLGDEGRWADRMESGNAVGVDTVVFRRGTVRVESGRLLLVEVEQDVSAREVQAEVGLPMFADATLAAFA